MHAPRLPVSNDVALKHCPRELACVRLCSAALSKLQESTEKRENRRLAFELLPHPPEFEIEIGSLLRANHPKGWDAKLLA
jgi:hypothetical protein